MTIEARLADGRVLQFPDGTDPAVIQATVKRILGQSQPEQPQQSQFSSAGREALSGLELAGVVGSSIIAEPIAGLAGIAQAINPFAEEGAGARAVEATREALTLEPRMPETRRALGTIGEVAEPAAEGFEFVGDTLGSGTLELTGSPALAAAAKTAPTALLEAIGGGAALRATKSGKLTGSQAFKAGEKQVSRALVESAPDIDVIKDASRAVYKEIDDIGAKVKPEAVNSMLKTVIRKARSENVDSVLTPKSARVVSQFVGELDKKQFRNIGDLDQLRKKAQIAAASADPSDARVGALMIDEIDSFMDNLPRQAFEGDAVNAANVGSRYKTARKLWGRARRAELIQEAMDKAARDARGFENGMRNQLRAILNNKKRSRFFTKDELAAMDDVVKGSTEQNVLKLVGRLGFSEGQATNILGGLAGTAVFGPVAPVVGQVSRGLAQRSTKKAAELSDAIVKAGPNAKKITEAYLKLTPPKQRSSIELSNIFLDSNVDIDELLDSANKATREAAEVAKGRKAFGAGAVTTGSAAQQPTAAQDEQ